jgi:hypothetical protein
MMMALALMVALGGVMMKDNNRLLFSITKVAPCVFDDDDPVDPGNDDDDDDDDDDEAILSNNSILFSYCSSLILNKDDKLWLVLRLV